MQITEEQKKSEQPHFTAVWNFYKKYYTPEDNQGYWQAVVDEAGTLSKNLNDLGIALLLAVIEELKHKAEKGGKNA